MKKALITFTSVALITVSCIVNFSSCNSNNENNDNKTYTKQTENNYEEIEDYDYSNEYVLSEETKKFHYPECHWVNNIKSVNKGYYNGSRDNLIRQGYKPCGTCKP